MNMKHQYCVCKINYNDFKKDELCKYKIIHPTVAVYKISEYLKKGLPLADVTFNNNFIIVNNRKLILYLNNLWLPKDNQEHEIFNKILEQLRNEI